MILQKIIDNKTKAILLNSHVINASETLPKISKDEIKNIIGKNNLVFFDNRKYRNVKRYKTNINDFRIVLLTKAKIKLAQNIAVK